MGNLRENVFLHVKMLNSIQVQNCKIVGRCDFRLQKRPSPNRIALLMEEILHRLRLVVYPIIYRVWYMSGGARFQLSAVLLLKFSPITFKNQLFSFNNTSH